MNKSYLGFNSENFSRASHADAPAELVHALKLSREQAKKGLTVPLEPALDRLRQSIDRMKTKRAAQSQH